MAIKFSQFVVETSASTMSHIVGYDGADNIQITPNNFFTSFVTGTAGQVPFFGSTTSLLGDNDFSWDNSNKRLGIGTTSPSRTLHVKTDSGVLIKGASGSVNAKISLVPASGGRQYDLGNVGSDFRIFDSSAGVTRMYFDNDGNTGIGTTSPGTTLDVVGTLASSGITQLGTGGSNVLLTSASAGNVGIGSSSPSYKLDIYGDSSSGIVRVKNVANGRDTFRSENAAGTRTLNFGNDGSGNGILIIRDSVGNVTNYITGSGDSYFNGGNVGIGTTSPTSKLSISGSQTAIDLTRGTAGDSKWGFSSDSTALYIAELSTGSTDYIMTLKETTGNVGIGTTSPSAKLEVVGNIKADSTGNTQVILESGGSCVMGLLNAQSEAYLRTTTAHDLHFRTTNINRMVIKAGGNVGIGTTSPSAKLEVAGGADTQAVITGTTTAARLDIKTNSHHRFLQTIESDGRFRLFNQTTNSEQFSVASNNDATFAGLIKAKAGAGLGYTFDNDLDTYIDNPSANTLRFRTTGANALTLDSSQNATFEGNVTIANTSVSQTSPTTQLLFDNNNIDNGGGYNIDFKSSSNDTANRFMARIQALRGSGAISSLGFFTETGSALTRALLLDSSQNATFAGRVIIQDTDTESFRINGTSATGSFVRYQTNGTNIGFFGAAYHLIGSSPAGYENDFGIRAESDLRFTIGASEKMSIINNGNVGIGTNTPTAKLTVVGLAEHADNAAAISAGLTTGAFYRTGDLLKVVH